MKAFFISVVVLYLIVTSTFVLSLIVLKFKKNSGIYRFVKKHIITDEDLEEQ